MLDAPLTAEAPAWWGELDAAVKPLDWLLKIELSYADDGQPYADVFLKHRLNDWVGAIRPSNHGDGWAFVTILENGVVHDHRHYPAGEAVEFPNLNELVVWAVGSRCGVLY